MRVHHIGHDVVVHHRVLAEDRVDRHLRLCERDVGELRRSRITDAVPDGPHAADVRAHAVIDRDAEAVRRKAGLLDTGEVRDPARPEQELIPFEGLLLAIDLRGDDDPSRAARDLGHLGVRLHLHAARLECPDENAHDLGVRVGDRLRQHLEDRHR